VVGLIVDRVGDERRCIVSIEGVDSSGKSTLCKRTQALFGLDRVEILRIDPFLPAAITENFAAWVCSVPGEEIAHTLLHASTLRRKAIQDVTKPIILLDRGPWSVAASARAHWLQSARSPDRDLGGTEGLPALDPEMTYVFLDTPTDFRQQGNGNRRYAEYLELFALEYRAALIRLRRAPVNRDAARHVMAEIIGRAGISP
jgi:thymidylate kinase